MVILFSVTGNFCPTERKVIVDSATLLCLVSAVFWAAAPLIGRYSAVNPWMMATLVAGGSFLVVLPIIFLHNFALTDPRGIAIGLIAGVVNGIGLLAFYRLIAGSGQGLWDISRIVPLVFVMVPIFTSIGAFLLFKEDVTPQRIIGLVLAAGAIWFLK